jgi:hypothetical protein
MFAGFYLAGIAGLPALCARYTCGRRHGIPLAFLLVLFAGFAMALLFLFNDYFPFTGWGDDTDYYRASLQGFTSLSAWFDFSQFKKFEQGGYPLILTWLHQAVGDSLYLRKCLNLFLFLMLPIIWYRIGELAGGRRLAVAGAVAVMFTTPLWFYWAFLLKDMAIILIQSVFLAALLSYSANRKVSASLLVIFLSTLALVPFRVMLVAFNMALFLPVLLFFHEGKGRVSVLALRWVAGTLLVAGMLFAATNSSVLSRLGATGQNRSLEKASVKANLDFYAKLKSRRLSSAFFPVLYVVGEVGAFNPATWEHVDAMVLREASVVPWIFVGVPLFCVGVGAALRPRRQTTAVVAVEDEGLGRRGMLILAAFIAGYVAVSWISNDTTRWRMPAMPAMAAMAGWGWITLRPGQRFLLLLGWLLAAACGIITYYSVFK